MTDKIDYTKIELVFFDIDGTFVDDDKNISPETNDVMDKLISRGIKLIPCTGRGFGGVSCYPEVLEKSNYAICYDGGLIFDNSNGKETSLIRKLVIEKEIFEELKNIIPQNEVTIIMFCNNEMYHTDNATETEIKGLSIWGSNPVGIKYEEIKNLREIQLMLIYGRDEIIDDFHKNVEEKFSDNLNIIKYDSERMFAKGIILKNRNTHKGEALNWLCNELGVKVENTMALGDWYNDLSLLQNAGIGVAMKNAKDKVKEVANTVTEFDNNEFGAIEHLKKLL